MSIEYPDYLKQSEFDPKQDTAITKFMGPPNPNMVGSPPPTEFWEEPLPIKMPQDSKEESVEAELPTIPEKITVESEPSSEPLPEPTVPYYVTFAKYWDQLGDAAAKIADGISARLHPDFGKPIKTYTSEEHLEEFRRFGTSYLYGDEVRDTIREDKRQQEFKEGLHAIPNLIEEWTSGASSAFHQAINTVRGTWAEAATNELQRVGDEISEGLTSYQQWMSQRLAPVRWARAIEGWEMDIEMSDDTRAPLPEITTFLKGIGWTDDAIELGLKAEMDRLREEKFPDVRTDLFWEERPEGVYMEHMSPEEWRAHQRREMNILQEALHNIKRDVVDNRFNPTERVSPRLAAAMQSIGNMEWLDWTPNFSYGGTEEIDAIIRGNGLNILDHIPDLVEDVDPETGAPNLWIGIYDIMSGRAIEEAHEFGNFFDPNAVKTRHIADSVINMALGKYIGNFMGIDTSNFNSLQMGSELDQMGRRIKSAVSHAFSPEAVGEIFKNINSWNLPYVFDYLGKTLQDFKDNAPPEVLAELELEKYGSFGSDMVTEMSTLLDEQITATQLQIKRQETARMQADQIEQNMNNPEYMRLRYLAETYQSLGIEDPTGNNWQEFETEDGFGNTWEQAVYDVVAKARNGEIGMLKDLSVLRYYKKSLEVAAIVNRRSPDPVSDGINKQVREWSISDESGQAVSEGSSVIWGMVSGNSKLQQALSQNNPSPDMLDGNSTSIITGRYNEILDIYRMASAESMVADATSLPGGFTLEKALAGEWGVNPRDLNPVELSSWARTLQIMGTKTPTKETPNAVKQVGDILYDNLSYLDGRNMTVSEKAKALGAAYAVSLLRKGSSDSRAINLDKFFANRPRHVVNFLGAISGMVSQNISRGSITYEMGGMDLADISMRFLNGEDISITHNGTEYTNEEAVHIMFQEYNRGVDLFGSALQVYQYETSPEAVRQFSNQQTAAFKVVDIFGSPEYRRNRSAALIDEEGAGRTLTTTLMNSGISITNYGSDTIDLSRSVAEPAGTLESEDSQLLQALVQQHPLLSPSFEGEEGVINAGEAEARMFRVVASNPQTAGLLSAMIYARQANSRESVSSTQLLSDTLSMLGSIGLKMMRTGPNDSDIMITAVPQSFNDVDWEKLPRTFDAEGNETYDDRTKITQAMRARGLYVPITNRNPAAFDNYVVPHIQRSGEFARSFVAQTLGIDPTNPAIDKALGIVMEREKIGFTESRRSIKDKESLDGLKIEPGQIGGASLMLAEMGRPDAWDRLSEEEQQEFISGYDYRSASLQDIMMGVLDITMDEIYGDGRANAHPELNLLLLQSSLVNDKAGGRRTYPNIRFRMDPGAALTSATTGINAPSDLRIIMEVGDQLGTPDYRINLNPDQINQMMEVSLVDVDQDNALGKFLSQAEGPLSAFWTSLWQGSYPNWEFPEEIDDGSTYMDDIKILDNLAEQKRKEGMDEEDIQKAVKDLTMLLQTKDRYRGSIIEGLRYNRDLLHQGWLHHSDRGDAPSLYLEKKEQRRRAMISATAAAIDAVNPVAGLIAKPIAEKINEDN